jgi:hypothetical protein
LDRNIVNVCFNDNDNFLDAKLVEIQEPLPPPTPRETILSINKDWFLCNNQDIDCVIKGTNGITFEPADSNSYVACTQQDDNCPFVVDTDLNIEILGNNPIPNTISALVDTKETVKIGAGSYNIIEPLSQESDESFSLIREWGSSGSDDGQFNFPWSLALDENTNVYVVDRNNARIQQFDSSGNFITKWNVGPFQTPVDIAIDSSNNVYVAVISNGINMVNKYTSDGIFIKDWFVAGPNPFVDVQNAIEIDSMDNVYVSSNNQIFKYTNDGELITSWGSGGSEEGQFNQPVGIASDSLNNIYVTDKYNMRVQKFSSNGEFISEWGSNCQEHRVFCSEPQGISTDSDNNVYVTEYNAGRISKFNNEGEFITGWNVQSAYGIDIDRLSDNVFISTGTNHIQVYKPISNLFSDVNTICKDSGFDAGELRTYISNEQRIKQITCVNFVGECSGEVEDGETRECTVQNYVIAVNDSISNNGEVDFQTISNESQQILTTTNDIIQTTTTTSIIPTIPFTFGIPTIK